MSYALKQLIQHLEDRKCRFLVDEEHEVVRINTHTRVGSYEIVVCPRADRELFQVFGLAPVRIPTGARPAVAEAIARANYGMTLGRFELDFEDGELRLHADTVMVSNLLSDEVIERLISCAVQMLDLFMPAILAIVYGNESPADSIRMARAEIRHAEADQA